MMYPSQAHSLVQKARAKGTTAWTRPRSVPVGSYLAPRYEMPKLLASDQEYARRTRDHASSQTTLRLLYSGDNKILATLTSFVGSWRGKKNLPVLVSRLTDQRQKTRIVRIES